MKAVTPPTVLVAGASGLVGYATVEQFLSEPGWDVVGVSRRRPVGLEGATLHSIDLLDAAACERLFGQMADVTHLVYAALQEAPGLFGGWLDSDVMDRNAAMLRNLFEPLSAVAAGLRHVSLLHGTKAYGVHHPSVELATVKVPLREREPRREHPNFYFLQEDYLREKRVGHDWGLTIFRPTVVYGLAPGNNMNPIPALGVYAAILKERGEPLHFPGQPGAGLKEAVDADLLARAIGWAATAEPQDVQAYNVTNGDVFTWENMWPAIADSLGMAVGEHRPFSLRDELAGLDGEWAAVVDKYNLSASRSVVEFVGQNSVIYADMVLSGRSRSAVPMLNSTIKIRQAGFAGCMDSEDMFRSLFTRMQETGQLPRWTV